MILIGIGISAVAAWNMHRMTEEMYRRFLSVVGTAMFLSEIWKQWYLTFRLYGGHYNVWYFPFQLCSLPMYLYLLYAVIPEVWRKRIDIFVMDFSLMGGLAAFLDPTGMQYSRWMLTVHSYLWHFLLIFLGCLSGFRWVNKGNGKSVKASFREFVGTLPIFGVSVVLAMFFNLTLWRFGEISMFYLSPFEISSQLVFRDIGEKAGIPAGNICYLLAMLMAALIFHGIWCGGRSLRRKSNP